MTLQCPHMTRTQTFVSNGQKSIVTINIPLHDTVFKKRYRVAVFKKRYRVAAGSARPLDPYATEPKAVCIHLVRPDGKVLLLGVPVQPWLHCCTVWARGLARVGGCCVQI